MNGVSQETFLAQVRQSMTDPGERISLPDDLEAARVVGKDPELVALFCQKVDEAKMQPYRVADDAGMVDQVLRILLDQNATSVVVPDEEIPGREALLAGLKDQGITPADPNDREANFTADVGITGVTGAVAETGSFFLTSGGPRRRLASLAVPCHIAIVRAEQIVPDLLDWGAGMNGPLPAGSVLVSGPSKTADIELTLVIGVHGPRHEHVIVVG